MHIDLQVAALDEIVKRVLAELVVEHPEVADIAYVLSQRAVVLSLCHVQVGYGRIALLESVHCQFVSFSRNPHRPFRYHALLPLVVELCHSGEHLPSEVVIRLLHLRSDYLLRRFRLLHLSLAQAPVEERNAE